MGVSLAMHKLQAAAVYFCRDIFIFFSSLTSADVKVRFIMD